MNLQLRPGQKLSILVVDDEEDIRSTLRMFLEMMEIFTFVVEASDGSDAYQKAMKQEFDLIVTDLAMPRVRGIEFIQNFKAFEAKNKRSRDIPETPFIILSGNVTGDEIKQAIDMGVRYVVTKPCAADAFIQKVSEALTRHKKHKIKVID